MKNALYDHLDYARNIDLPSQEYETAVGLYKIRVIEALQRQDYSQETMDKLDGIQQIVKDKLDVIIKKQWER